MTTSQSIPTLPDLMHGIEAWMLERAHGPDIPADLQTEVDRILDAGVRSGVDLFTLIAVARGCHSVAEERRQRDDPGAGYCFHHFGQILLDRAVSMVAEIAAAEMRKTGAARH